MSGKGRLSRIKLQFSFALAVAIKDARIYYVKPPVLIFGIFFPICLFCAFAIGRGISTAALLPGMLGMTLFFISSSSTPVIAPWETMTRTLERLVSTPAPIGVIVSGDIIAGFLYGICVSLLSLSAGVLIFGSTVMMPIILAIVIILSAFCFSSLGSLLSTLPTDSPANIMLLSNVVRLPLIFISGVFIPIDKLPGWGKIIAVFSPLTYTCDLARHALLGNGHYPISLGLLLLLAFTVTFFFISIQIHKKSMPKRLS